MYDYSSDTFPMSYPNTVSNFANSTVSPDYVWKFLEQLDWYQFVNERIPTFVFLLVISVIGNIIGNSHAIVIFRKYPLSSVTVLIRWIVHVDLLACFICIPLELVHIRHRYTYQLRILCKITRYSTHFTSLSSGVLLLLAAIERRQKICAPFNWQLSLRKAKCVGIFVLASTGIISVPAAVYYDVFDHKTSKPEIVSRDCRDSKDFEQAKMYALFVLVIILSGFLVCTVAYIQIIKVIRTQLEIEQNRSKSNSLWETRFAAEKSEQNSRRASLKEKVENLEISENTCNNSDTLSRTPKSPREKRYKDSWTITMMIMIATGISFVGYILHFCAVIMKTTFRPETLDKIRPVYILIIRGYFLQSAIHPLIYCIVNKTFRKEGKTVYRKTINRLRSRKK